MSLAGSGVLENRAVGIAAALIRGNDTLLLKGYGKADVEWNVPVPVDAEFEAGTITHPFTAVALLQLHNEGKLSRDDPGRDDARLKWWCERLAAAIASPCSGERFSAPTEWRS